MKKFDITTALAFLSKMVNGIAVSNGAKSKKGLLYVAGTGTTLTNNQNYAILPKDTKQLGYNNFDQGNKLNTGKSFEVTAMRILFDSATAGVTPLTANWVSNAPVAFQNGEIVIDQQGKGELLNIPMLPLFRRANATNSIEDDYCAVVPFVLSPNVETNIQVKQAGVPIDGTVAWRIELDGIWFTDAANS